MAMRMTGTIMRAIAAMTATLSSAAAFALQATPPATPATAPTTAPVAAVAPSGDWFSGAAQRTPPKPGEETDAQLFARLYPELAKADPVVRAATPRLLFDAMLSKGKPALKIVPMVGAYNPFTEASDRAYKLSKPPNPWLLVPDERRAKIAAVHARQTGGSIFIDIETLPLDVRRAPLAEVKRSVSVIAQSVAAVRTQDPNLRLFLYACFPISDNYIGPSRARAATTKPGGSGYEWWKANIPKFETHIQGWREANTHLVELASMFDGTCPSLYIYPFEELQDETTAIPGFVRETVNEARRYGKPVYPFVWYLLCDTNIPVPLKQWTTLMREVMTHADGAVLWDGQNPWNNRGALRVRIAMLLAERKGAMTDAEIYDVVKADYPGDTEVQVLRDQLPTTVPNR